MVKIKEGFSLLPDGTIDLEHWLQDIASKGYSHDIELIRHACSLSQIAGAEQATEIGESCFRLGLSMADILADLEVDPETLIAAIIFESVHYAELSLDDVVEQLGPSIGKLVKGVEKMSAISSLHQLNRNHQNKQQLDNIRKMLLAMVDDVRVVLIKLAERLCILRSNVPMPIAVRQNIAIEAMEIYAPLANRLGIGAIKWEMEDLAFRYLHPDDYKNIAKGLNAKRLDRDRFVNMIVEELNREIHLLKIPRFSVYGRSKHIHSIYRKMVRKNVDLDEIYDATAVRILVATEEECYQVLSVVHSLWQPIPVEFDDYIANPKLNGYRSLHTAVKGPENRAFEVQIRTFDMHDKAEMGVAAHWKYKEGGRAQQASHERKIEWLREVLAWHREIASNKDAEATIETEFLEDRVYIFTPDGDVLDLPEGVTALDFAYHVHSEVGHRCRGAKVNGHIVPLTYCLKTGDRVEILTGKVAKPSRDWINPHHNYLKTSRAKAKVLHWFKEQDFEKNLADGEEVLDKELKALGIKSVRLQGVAEAMNFKRIDDMLAALGRGDIKLGQIIARLTPNDAPAMAIKPFEKSPDRKEQFAGDLRIGGIGNLLTYMARCCQPLPGDAVIGYITQGRGVSIHRKECSNILHSTDKQKQRFIEVHWESATREQYVVDVMLKAFDRHGLLRDITALLSHEKAHVFALQTQTDPNDNLSYIKLTLEIDGLTGLSRMLAKLSQIPNVIDARRLV
jgi:GTP pyrophosphokinase